jgi:hypothetical protein
MVTKRSAARTAARRPFAHVDVVEVFMWQTHIGSVTLDPAYGFYVFNYTLGSLVEQARRAVAGVMVDDDHIDGMGDDHELGASQHYGRVEYAYHLMARAAGIDMTDCRLLEAPRANMTCVTCP